MRFAPSLLATGLAALLALAGPAPAFAENLAGRALDWRAIPLDTGGIRLERTETLTSEAARQQIEGDSLALPPAYRGFLPAQITAEVIRAVGLRVAMPEAEQRADGALVLSIPPLQPADQLVIRAKFATRVAALPGADARPAPDRIVIESMATLRADGVLEGEARTEARGDSALLLQNFTGALAQRSGAELADFLLTRQMIDGNIGPLSRSALEKGGFEARLAYSFRPNVQRDGLLSLPLQPGPRLVRGAHVNLVSHLREKRGGDAACPHQNLRQSVQIKLPEGYPALVLPPDVTIQLGPSRYTARYQRLAEMLIIERDLLIDAGGPVCSAEKLKEIAPVIHAAAHDMARRLTLPGR